MAATTSDPVGDQTAAAITKIIIPGIPMVATKRVNFLIYINLDY